MLNIAFCDDNKYFLKKISNLVDIISKVPISYKCFNSAKSLIENFQSGIFDALFIDIYMPELNGKMLARKVRAIDRHVKIIFVTRYENEILNTLQYDIYDFLPKDQLKMRLENTITRLIKSVNFEHDKYIVLMLRNNTTNKIVKKIYTDNIMYIGVKSRKVYLYLINNEKFEIINYRFHEILTLMEQKNMLLVNRGLLVNPAYINEIQKNIIILDNGKQLPLSRRKQKKVKEQFMCGLRRAIYD